MKQLKLPLTDCLALPALIALFWFGTPANAQSTPAQGGVTASPSQPNSTTAPAQDPNDAIRAQLANFDQFLDGHPEIAEQVRKNPSLTDNQKFVKDHPALQTYLQQHPEVRADLKQNPNAFMRREDNFNRRDDFRGRDNDMNREEVSRFHDFMDSHREIAEQLRKNPSLANRQEFVENHPALLTYLQDHPGARASLRQDPNAFMRQEDNFDRRDDAQARDYDRSREERARFDQFLDGHHEIAEQVRKNPSLLNDDKYAKDHPVLQAYLQDHPGIRDQARDNPNAFMHQEGQFDRNDREDFGRNNEMTHDRTGDFRQFLNGHTDIAQQLSHNPSLAKDKDYMRNHPEFQDYLKTHPDVNQELMNNPDSFIKSAQAQPFTNKSDQGVKTPNYDPKATH